MLSSSLIPNATADANDLPGTGDHSDQTLPRQYVKHRSEAAFARIIQRHLGLVYATCRRETGDAELAEDVTQAVFLVLAKKASRLRGGDSLAGWLFQTARFASRNAVRRERSRLRQEQEIAAQEIKQILDAQAGEAHDPWSCDPLWQTIEPLLNAAVARLRPPDREAILLRFFEGYALAEVGTRLGVSENTARMRVSRALERLRRHLAQEEAILSSAALAALLADRAVQAAPATAAAHFPVAVSIGPLPISLAAVKVSQLAQGVLHTMWMKSVTTFASIFTLTAALTAVAVAVNYHNRISGVDWTDSPLSGQNLAFQQGLSGWGKAAPNSGAPDYLILADSHGPAPSLPSALLTARTAHPHGYGTLIQGIRADRYLGKRLRFSASLRTAAVVQGAGVWLRMDDQEGVLAWNREAHPVKGTTGWHRYSYVLDVPKDTQGMCFGSNLTGPGKVWLADVRLETVGKDVPLTPNIEEEASGELPGDTPRVLHLWDLGRSDRNEELEVAATAIVADTQAPAVERCTAREALALAEMRLGLMSRAQADLAKFNTERQGLPVDPGVVAEANRMAKRLATLSAR